MLQVVTMRKLCNIYLLNLSDPITHSIQNMIYFHLTEHPPPMTHPLPRDQTHPLPHDQTPPPPMTRLPPPPMTRLTPSPVTRLTYERVVTQCC